MYSVVIPSGHLGDLLDCLSALALHQPLAPQRIRVVADKTGAQIRDSAIRKIVTVIDGPQPFNWCRNVNLGMNGVEGDVVVMDDNATLLTNGGLDFLAETARYKGVGIVGPQADGVAPRWQQRPSPPGSVRWVLGACMFIARSKCSFDFDERLRGRGFQDIDFCRMAAQKGLETVIDARCSIHHRPSRYSRTKNDPGTLSNRAAYYRKWGDLNFEGV